MIANSVSTQQGTFVAIDVAKQVHEVLVEPPTGHRQRWRIRNCQPDYEALRNRLRAMETPVLIGFEATGNAWCTAINKAAPGTDVILGPGFYTDPCSIKVSGKAGAPITIRSESSDSSKRAVLAYPGSSSNVIDLRRVSHSAMALV